MYCVKCGVELKDSEKFCPLCMTPVFHPDIKQGDAERSYPEYQQPAERKYLRRIVLLVLTVFMLLAAAITLIIDLRLGSGISWSGYVIGGIALAYIVFILPFWFRRPNPVIFIPCSFAAAILYLCYIAFSTGGDWFLSFAFPVTGIAGIIVTTVAALTKYLHSGHLFIYGGAIIAIGIYTVLIELFCWLTFDIRFVLWSLYPLVCCSAIGLLLIVIGICKPLRQALSKKFFI